MTGKDIMKRLETKYVPAWKKSLEKVGNRNHTPIMVLSQEVANI